MTCRTEKKYFAFCRLFKRRISYDVFQEKEGDLNDVIIALIYISADWDDRMEEREIELFFFVFVQNARKCRDWKG
jgi:hypothetical protein